MNPGKTEYELLRAWKFSVEVHSGIECFHGTPPAWYNRDGQQLSGDFLVLRSPLHYSKYGRTFCLAGALLNHAELHKL